jgi:hypothetical protein
MPPVSNWSRMTVMTNCDAISVSGCRPPDQRYRRASEHCRTHRPASPKHDDLRTRQLLQALRRRSARPASLARPPAEFSDLMAAIELREQRHPVCPLLEAHLLAGTPPEQIAQRLGLSEAAIEAYHDCFFDVRSRLSQHDYIVYDVILADSPLLSARCDVEIAVKLIAYLQGPEALAELLQPPTSASGGVAGYTGALASAAEALADVLLYVSLLRQSAGNQAIARQMLLLSIRRRASEKRPTPLNVYEANVKAMLDGLEFHCGRPDPESVPPALAPFLDASFELHADEMTYLAQGGKLPYLDELLERKNPLQRRPDDGAAGADNGG